MEFKEFKELASKHLFIDTDHDLIEGQEVEIHGFDKLYEALSIGGVSKRFTEINDALGYLNRGGYHFKERILLSDETLMLIANDIYDSTTIKNKLS